MHSAELDRVRSVYPELIIREYERYNGQFNDVFIVNGEVIYRFPRSAAAAETLQREIAILSALRGRTPLPIPNPIYSHSDQASGQPEFMGYPIIPGVPISRAWLAAIDDEDVLNRLAIQLATFLRELHATPLESIPLDLPVAEDFDDWSAVYADFREQLFPYMRRAARRSVAASFDRYLSDARHFDFTPVLRHGDFGTGNLLVDPAELEVSGIIDFGFAGPGDPAQDLGSLLASFGRDFVDRLFPSYPALEEMIERATFYVSTYALLQALSALRDGDQEMFDDGIAAYR